MSTVPDPPQAAQPSAVAAEEPGFAGSPDPVAADAGESATLSDPASGAQPPRADAPAVDSVAASAGDDGPPSADEVTDPVLILDPDEDGSGDEVLILDADSSDDDSSVDSSDDEVLILDAEPSESELRLAELDARVAVLEVELATAQEEARSNKNRLLRTAADYENFRRRTTKEKEDLERFSAQRVVREFLPVMDNLERALKHAGDDGEVPTSSLREGVDMVMKQFRQSLEKQGVVGFDSHGQMFDPQVHEAIQQVDTVDHPTGTIINEFQRGYNIHDKLLRPALVVVARNTSEDDA